MLVLLGLFALLCLAGMKLTWKKGETADYLSVPHTQSIKGIFILLVFFSHFNSYAVFISSGDLLYRHVLSYFGQTMVTLFLFYSGYGVMESIRKKGEAYVQSIPMKRILATLFRFNCAVVLFVLLGWVQGDSFTPGQLLLSLIGWESVGNSNWYIFVILVLYVFTYAAFSLFRKRGAAVSLLALTCMCLVYILVISGWNLKPFHWYDTVLCYPLGMAYALYRKPVEKVVNRNRGVYLCFLALFGGIFLVCLPFAETPGIMYIRNISFTLMIVLGTMRVTLHNPVLSFCGQNLFELYILQRIPMAVFARTPLAGTPVIYFVVCFAVTLAMMVPFKWVTNKGWNILVSRK